MIGPMLRVLVIGLVLLVAAMLASIRLGSSLPAPERATYLETPLPLPPFELTSADRRAFTKASLDGRYTLLFFGFTNCPDICPLTLTAIAAASRELQASAPGLVPEVVFVSVDPRRDTLERIAEYLAAFDAQFVGVTGERVSLDPLLHTLGVTVMTQALPDRPGYTVTHNGTIYVVGPDAALIATMSSGPSATEIARDFRRVRALYQRNGASHSSG